MLTLAADTATTLVHWYRQNARILPWRENTDPYRIWVSEIMLQQTRVEAVKPYFQRFMQVFPTVYALAAAPEAAYLKLWEGLGYYSRVRNLAKAAQLVVRDFQGQLPTSEAALRRLPGIGEYTAGAIVSIAYNQPAAAVDGNVIRIVARLCDDHRLWTTPAQRREIAEAVRAAYTGPDWAGYSQSFMELGSLVCLGNGRTRCANCPLSTVCLAQQRGTAASLPERPLKAARPIEEKTILLLYHAGRLAVRRRPNSGLLAGLWEFPWLPGHCPETVVKQVTGTAEVESLPAGEHVFTHRIWHMTGYAAEVTEPHRWPDCEWVTPETLRRELAMPSAFQIYLRQIASKTIDSIPFGWLAR